MWSKESSFCRRWIIMLLCFCYLFCWYILSPFFEFPWSCIGSVVVIFSVLETVMHRHVRIGEILLPGILLRLLSVSSDILFGWVVFGFVFCYLSLDLFLFVSLVLHIFHCDFPGDVPTCHSFVLLSSALMWADIFSQYWLSSRRCFEKICPAAGLSWWCEYRTGCSWSAFPTGLLAGLTSFCTVCFIPISVSVTFMCRFGFDWTGFYLLQSMVPLCLFFLLGSAWTASTRSADTLDVFSCSVRISFFFRADEPPFMGCIVLYGACVSA